MCYFFYRFIFAAKSCTMAWRNNSNTGDVFTNYYRFQLCLNSAILYRPPVYTECICSVWRLILKRWIKKGVQIGVLTTAVAAGSMLLSGCQQHTAETYNKGLVNDFETSLANRPAAQNYFYEYTNALKSNRYYHINEIKPGNCDFDSLINRNNRQSTYIFADIIKNLPTSDERRAFQNCYRILANEAYKEGLGTSRNGSNSYMTKYQKEKDSIVSSIEGGLIYDGYQSFQNIDLEQEYGANNFANITNLLDSLIDTATTNMNQSASLGLNGELESQDLRQIVNLTIANQALTALHDRTAYSLLCFLSRGS